MNATPVDVLPLLASASGPLYEALRVGVEFADTTMLDIEPSFHSHCVRYRARMELATHCSSDWSLNPCVSNSGIHLRLGGIHQARLLRSLNGGAPHPGRGGRVRTSAWSNPAEQLVLALDDQRRLAPLSLLLDWHLVNDEPVVHVSLPKRPWKFGHSPQLHWRVRLDDAGGAMDSLEFTGAEDLELDVSIELDPTELGTEEAG